MNWNDIPESVAVAGFAGVYSLVRTFGGLRPVIVCLCGSTRFGNFFREANYELTLRGEIVLSIGCDTKADEGLGITGAQKAGLDELHKRKVDLADWVLVVSDETGYFGESTASEIRYALALGKPVAYREPAAQKRAADLGLAGQLPVAGSQPD